MESKIKLTKKPGDSEETPVGYLDGIPVFNTIHRAIEWARNFSLEGYHTHTYNGKIGYMGGTNHELIQNVLNPTQAPLKTLPEILATPELSTAQDIVSESYSTAIVDVALPTYSANREEAGSTPYEGPDSSGGGY